MTDPKKPLSSAPQKVRMPVPSPEYQVAVKELEQLRHLIDALFVKTEMADSRKVAGLRKGLQALVEQLFRDAHIYADQLDVLDSDGHGGCPPNYTYDGETMMCWRNSF